MTWHIEVSQTVVLLIGFACVGTGLPRATLPVKTEQSRFIDHSLLVAFPWFSASEERGILIAAVRQTPELKEEVR